MDGKVGFNLFNHEATNQDIEVIYTPDASIVKYEYQIIKDGEEEAIVSIHNANATNILLTETGKYQIRVLTTDQNGRKKTATSGLFIIDKKKPIIDVGEKQLTMEIGSTLEPLEGIKVTDNLDGDLINKVQTNYDELDFTTTGLKTLTYTVSDSAGNVTSESIYVNVVTSKQNELAFFQIGIIFLLGIIILFTLFYRKSMRLEKRIGKYGVEPLKDSSTSFQDQLHLQYKKVLDWLKKGISKSVFMTDYGKKYDKYVGVIDNDYTCGLDFVANKIMVSFVVLLIAVFSKTIQYQVLDLYEICFPLILGFYVPDFIYMYHYKQYRERLENDLLQAIIVMNNAFKSGRSITQAIDLVTRELDGPISIEFKKMSMELSFGLSLEDVFKRFSERVKLEEVAYLTASLSILNKTGGNIIKVFSSIENSLFNKKKLKLELESLTGSSRIIMYVLFCVPILFIVFVSILNPNYFAPFFTSQLGWLLMIFILVMYIAYIMIVRKMMKVRM